MKEIVDIKEKIENMNKYHQIEVLRILKEENNYKIILVTA